MTRVSVLVSRRGEHRKFSNMAVTVSAVQNELVDCPGALYKQLRAAVEAWFCAGGEGAKHAWAYSCADYNIGDLSTDLDDPELQPFLARHGLVDLRVDDTAPELTYWTYDTVLVDADTVSSTLHQLLRQAGTYDIDEEGSDG